MNKICFSFSAGKDSVLALDRLIGQGYDVIGLLTSVDESIERSWFHGIPDSVLNRIEESVGIPIFKVAANADNYEREMTDALAYFRDLGAKACGFGDIDIPQNGEWDKKVASRTGLEALLPLWLQSREALVYEFLDRGYKAIIKTVSKSSGIPEHFLGEMLDQKFIGYLSEHNLDICGENGEYHTLVVSGPIYQKEIKYDAGGIHESQYSKSLIIN